MAFSNGGDRCLGGLGQDLGNGRCHSVSGPPGTGHQGTCPVRVPAVYGQLVSFSRRR